MPHVQTRRPRFERAPVHRMMLTPRDREILRAVYRHRLLSSRHLTALAGGSPQQILRRLQLLFHHGYLDRPKAQLDWYARGSEPLVYALAKSGAAALGEAGEVGGGIRWDTKNRTLSRAFLRHTLAVAEVMVAFEVACRNRKEVELIGPEEILAGAPEETRHLRLPLRWQVELHHNGKRHLLGVEPDRVFGLCFKGAPKGRERAYFFLEADRGTMPVTRKSLSQTSLLRKLLAYEETWRKGAHKAHLAIPNFRVLVVTASPERARYLIAVNRVMGPGESGLFLFTDAKALCRQDILTLGWTNGREETVRLVA